MVDIQSGLVRPTINQEDGVGIVEWYKVLVTQVASLLANAVRNATSFHFLSERTRIVSWSSIVKMHGDHNLRYKGRYADTDKIESFSLLLVLGNEL